MKLPAKYPSSNAGTHASLARVVRCIKSVSSSVRIIVTMAPSAVFGTGTLLGIGMLDKSDLFPPPYFPH